MFNSELLKTPGIYLITNPLGRVYVGQTTNLFNRNSVYSKLACKDQPKIHNSLAKYGSENHNFLVLQYCETHELNDLERFYIKKFNSTDRIKGLNLTTGGQNYFQHTPETRAKMSLAQLGNQKTKGRTASKEEIKKRSDKCRGQKRSAEVCARMSAAHKGVKLSKSHTESMSKAFKFRNSKRVKNTITGEIFKSVYLAAEFYNLKKSTLAAKLNGQNKNNTNLIYEPF